MDAYSVSFNATRMIVGRRIVERLTAVGLSQSELARRVPMSQGAMNNLIAGRSRSSTHLHKIARELQTTPAYLSGETNDPATGAQDGPTSYEDRQLLHNLRSVGKQDRLAFDQLARSLSQQSQDRPVIELPGERPLTAMFEALLAGINPSLPQDDKARLLAQRLPIALAQLQDLRPEPDTEAAEATGVVQPTPYPEPTR